MGLKNLISPRKEEVDMEIGVSWPGKRLVFKVKNTWKISELKTELEKKEGIPVSEQIFTFKGKLLKDNKTFSHYKIENDRTIIMSFSDPNAAAKRAMSVPPQRPHYAQNLESYKPEDPSTLLPVPVKDAGEAKHKTVPAYNPTPMAELEAAERVSPPRVVTDAASHFLEKEEDTDEVTFVVKHGKKEYKVTMSKNADIWAVKLHLEGLKVGKAGNLSLSDESGEELDDEGTLDEFDIGDDSVITVEV